MDWPLWVWLVGALVVYVVAFIGGALVSLWLMPLPDDWED